MGALWVDETVVALAALGEGGSPEEFCEWRLDDFGADDPLGLGYVVAHQGERSDAGWMRSGV